MERTQRRGKSEPPAGGLGGTAGLHPLDDASSVDASSALVFRAFQTALQLHRGL